MAESGCASCSFRARYDKNPKSILGRLWRWHANWCPGWRSYMKSLPDDEKAEIKTRYNM
ncbi:hypothetical protein ACFL2O_01925 [Thermodesulfobacteriota bacterium]